MNPFRFPSSENLKNSPTLHPLHFVTTRKECPGLPPAALPESLQSEKLVFESAHSKTAVIAMKNAVIANQCAHWCGNPPGREEMYRQLPYKSRKFRIIGGNRYLVPFNGGIATPVCGLARNDRKLENEA